MSPLETNLNFVRDRIKTAALRAGRKEKIILVAVTKTVGAPRVNEALSLGISDIGENRIQEAKIKFPELLKEKAVFHMIGHLQSNKVKDAVKLFDIIHSVDSLSLAEAIDREAAKSGKVMPCLIEINIGSEISKAGMQYDCTGVFLKEAAKYKNIKLEGLMTVAPITESPEQVRPFFKKMKILFDELKQIPEGLNFKHLSMGMSQDYEVAIEEGATMVRVGSALFGSRSTA
ncbi:MAG: YggS family pyridoxal phosphate enzyme [Candidatus Firestonebacteria bacterium RIFOXYC2_FULL_39_67]|nr:MAG: YggS family pyridoxal phosphate enzyme [Candidatus Firestonebacteria bacterium RIFOXYD2_FULL_39_29]OGF53619.1 MAG: YggS family pyridoxal phosphate enzyme [Candidatus Firestonebacteria bacterium RifOxyC12_full_39_7]OGF54075.1 MAG: YggS family pyridoxal phosphate enzyme [Candidatus Firestonebacteria bacterium RIFOXYC2_FULL_39_67]